MVLFPKVENGSSVFAHSFKEDYYFKNEDDIKIISHSFFLTNHYASTYNSVSTIMSSLEKVKINNYYEYQDFLSKVKSGELEPLLFIEHNTNNESLNLNNSINIYNYLAVNKEFEGFRFKIYNNGRNEYLNSSEILTKLSINNYRTINTQRYVVNHLEYYYYKEKNINILMDLFTDNIFGYDSIYLDNRRNRTNGALIPGVYDEKLKDFGVKSLIDFSNYGTRNFFNFSGGLPSTTNSQGYSYFPKSITYEGVSAPTIYHRDREQNEFTSHEFSGIASNLFIYDNKLIQENDILNIEYNVLSNLNNIPNTFLINNIKNIQNLLIKDKNIEIVAPSIVIDENQIPSNRGGRTMSLTEYESKEDFLNQIKLPSFDVFKYYFETKVGMEMKNFSTKTLFSASFSIALANLFYKRVLNGDGISYERSLGTEPLIIRPLLFNDSDLRNNQGVPTNYQVSRLLELKNLMLQGKIEEWSLNREFIEDSRNNFIGWSGLTDSGLNAQDVCIQIDTKSSSDDFTTRIETLNIFKNYLYENNIPNISIHKNMRRFEESNEFNFLFEGNYGLEFINEFFIHYENLSKLFHDYICDNSKNTEESQISLEKFYKKFNLKYYEENIMRVNYSILTNSFLLNNIPLDYISNNFNGLYRKPFIRDYHNRSNNLYGVIFDKEVKIPFNFLETPTLKSGLEV